MEEKLYTIPVMDAFKVDCECPLCKMRDDIENDNYGTKLYGGLY